MFGFQVSSNIKYPAKRGRIKREKKSHGSRAIFGFAKNQNIDGGSMGRTLLTLCTNRIQCGAFAAGCRSQDGVQGAAAEVG